MFIYCNVLDRKKLNEERSSMQDFLQLATILLAFLAVIVSKRNIQKGFSSLDSDQKNHFNTSFFRFRLIQYPVVFFIIGSALMINGNGIPSDSSKILFFLCFLISILWIFYVYRFVDKQRNLKVLPQNFLDGFLQDRVLLFIIMLLLMFSVFMKLQIYRLIYNIL